MNNVSEPSYPLIGKEGQIFDSAADKAPLIGCIGRDVRLLNWDRPIPHPPIDDGRRLMLKLPIPLTTTFVLGVCFFWPSPSIADSPVKAQRPNVLLILVDDMGLYDLSVEGSTFYQTPHIDRLARGGMQFGQGYAACSVCSPSRASILLGTFTARHGITEWIGAASGSDWKRPNVLLPARYVESLPTEQTTLAESLKQSGYRTFFAGKWHLGGEGSLPTDHGFDINIGGCHRGSPPGGYFAPYRNRWMKSGPDGESLTIRLGTETAAFINQQNDQPFFAMLSFYSVHGPLQTTQSLWSKYRSNAIGLAGEKRFKVDRTLPVRQVQDNPIYAGMVESTDTAVGMVLEALEQNGLNDSTIVIFTSDNGGVSSGDCYATSNLPLRGGKGRQWEGGVRVPFYIRYPPLIQTAARSDVPVTGADIFPTVLDLCGLPALPEQHVDGVSLVPICEGKTIADRPLFWHYPHYSNQGGQPSSIIRQGDWKLIHYYETNRNELYHLASDPGEQSDLADTNPDRAADMSRRLQSWLESVDANYPTPNPNYDPAQTEAFYRRAQTEKLESLERSAADVLRADYQPDADWWGSEPR